MKAEIQDLEELLEEELDTLAELEGQKLCIFCLLLAIRHILWPKSYIL
jgi:hypothetical protein